MASNILHMLFTQKHASPFDINMAVDAGYDVVVPYSDVAVDEVQPLVQDSIFSRPPGYFNHTGMFIGGRDVNKASDMLEAARTAMFNPFEICIFADPNGAYTTSAALIALIEKSLAESGNSLNGSTVITFGGGPVGLCAAVLAAKAGATPILARLTPGTPAKRELADRFLARYDVVAEHVDAQAVNIKRDLVRTADVIVSSAKAGVEVISKDVLQHAEQLKVAADVNAVPPAGIAGVGTNDKGIAVDGKESCLGIGALAIGNIKYKTQQALFKKMISTKETLVLDFLDAYSAAREIAAT